MYIHEIVPQKYYFMVWQTAKKCLSSNFNLKKVRKVRYTQKHPNRVIMSAYLRDVNAAL